MSSSADSSATRALDFHSLRAVFPASSSYTTSCSNSWAAIVSTILLGFGQESQMHALCSTLLSSPCSPSASADDSQNTAAQAQAQLQTFRVLREALLKASTLVGFPRSINGLTLLRNSLQALAPELETQLGRDKSLRADVPLGERHARGRAFFGKIYDKHTERVLANLNACSGGDLGEFAINCVYGDLMAETALLGEKETSLLEFVACVCLDVVPQAKGHMYGARNLGNSGAEIRAAIVMVKKIASALDAPWSGENMDAFFQKAAEW